MSTQEQRREWRELAKISPQSSWHDGMPGWVAVELLDDADRLTRERDDARTIKDAALQEVGHLVAERDAARAELAQVRVYMAYSQAELRRDEMPLLLGEWLKVQA